MKLFDDTFNGIEKKLTLHFKRHMLLTGNVANADTPGYRARELDFAGELQRVLKTQKDELKVTHQGHMDVVSSGGSHVVLDNKGAVGPDGNNIDIDVEMGKLAANGRGYTNTSNLLLVKLRILRTAARGRGGI